MRKFLSPEELSVEKNAVVTPMSSDDVKDFNLFMKQAVRISCKNSQKANTTASKVYLTR